MAPAVTCVADSASVPSVPSKTLLKSGDSKTSANSSESKNGVDEVVQCHQEGSFIWGCTLDKSSPSYSVALTTSDPDNERHVVELKAASLGPEAKDGERNVVEIESANWRGDKQKRLLTSLTAGQTDSVRLDLTLTWMPDSPIVLTLAAGSGPLTLTGTHFLGLTRGDVDGNDETSGDVTDAETEEEETDVKTEESADEKMES